jgi:hypothetical protein
MGRIVRSEADAVNGNDPSKRIPWYRRYRDRLPEKAGNLGTCGSGPYGLFAPISRYTCSRFQPWRDGPDREVLDWLCAERERKQTGKLDPQMVKMHDATILAVADVEAAVQTLKPQLPPGSPPLSEYLFLVPEHFFRTDMATMPAIVTVVSDAQIRCFLCTAGTHKSVFELLGIVNERGNPYRVRSHAFRHYLNTIAQDGCLPQLDIALVRAQAHGTEFGLRPHGWPPPRAPHAQHP